MYPTMCKGDDHVAASLVPRKKIYRHEIHDENNYHKQEKIYNNVGLE